MTSYEAAILDVDGTIVRGDELIPGATDGLRELRERNVSRVLFSNNPTRGPDHYRDRLAEHGLDIARRDPEDRPRIQELLEPGGARSADRNRDERGQQTTEAEETERGRLSRRGFPAVEVPSSVLARGAG